MPRRYAVKIFMNCWQYLTVFSLFMGEPGNESWRVDGHFTVILSCLIEYLILQNSRVFIFTVKNCT